MPIASFYELPPTLLTPHEQQRGMCRVIAKVWQVMGEADILCPDIEMGQIMDDLLWTFQAGAFVPHVRGTGESIRIHDGGVWPPQSKALVLCGLDELPAPVPACERLIDFIPAAERPRSLARERYRQLKNAGFTMQVHPLEA